MRQTPLHDAHVALGGKIIDFSGWALPVQYVGIVEEHLHTRASVSLFDCSHMGEFHVHGADALAQLDQIVCLDVAKLRSGRCKYGMLLNESGAIIDDIIIFRMAEDEAYIVTNAGPLAPVSRILCEGNPGVVDISDATAKIDVQGPEARDTLLATGFSEASNLKYFNACWVVWNGVQVLLSRTGYTGELGYELFLPAASATTLWEALIGKEGVNPAGLGARDTLRTEVGYPLSGQDFDEAITPLETAMDIFVPWTSEFTGKAALQARKDLADHPVLVGVRSLNRRAPRHGFEVMHDGKVVGEITSGTFGPSVGMGIGLARLPKALAQPGTQLTAGPRNMELEVAKIPFYTEGTCRS